MSEISFELVSPCEESAKLIMQWRNNPETLANSFNQNEKKWPAFYDEFNSEYVGDPSQPCFFALNKGNRIGLIRFRKIISTGSEKWVDISINLAPDFRAKGLGKSTLKSVVSQLSGLLRSIGYSKIIAEIFDANTVSIAAFESAGFNFLDQHEHKPGNNGQTLLVKRFELSLYERSFNQNGFSIGDGHPCFIIAEAGSNWRMGTPKRDLKMGYTLIDVAKEAGCNAVKFQTYRPETTYVKEAGQSDYLATNGIKDDISEIFKDLSMPYEMVQQLAEYAEKAGIIFMSSPFSERDLSEVDRFTPIHKIASYEITHSRLIDAAARTNKPLILSTGASEICDIERAIQRFKTITNSPVYLMQCTAKYPAPLSTLNLNVIPQLKTRFSVPVGLSDHSRDPITGPVCAVALGANLIEKHYTLNNDLPGPDHKFAVTGEELALMVKNIRQAEESLGHGVKQVLDEEKELYSFARRGLQALCDIPAGVSLLEGENFAILRPGKQKQGMNPMFIESIANAKSRRTIPSGDGIQFEDLELN